MTLRPSKAITFVGAASVLLILAVVGSQRAVTEARFVAPIEMPLPDYLKAARDPAFGTTFQRITKPGDLGSGVVCGNDYCSHRYSSAQAWNADQSLLVLANGCKGLCFLDGHTYQPLFRRDRSIECEWNPRQADQMICVGGHGISLWNPRLDRDEIVFASPDYHDFRFGPNKGNPSQDGNRVAVRAVQENGNMVVFAYDLLQRHKFPDIDLSRLPGKNSFCTITPLGDDILCMQVLEGDIEPTFIFSVDGTLRQSWNEHHRPGHGDLTIDADGNEVFVGISKSKPDEYQVIKRRLSDGHVTSLMRYGEAQHASLRSLNRPGWVFLSYAGHPNEVAQHTDWAPFAEEVVALRIDGSGEVRRIAQTHNPPAGYWSETHASPSPDGSQVIWSSNWGNPGGPVYEFVSQVDWSFMSTLAEAEVVAK